MGWAIPKPFIEFFFLKSIFLSSMSASIFKKSKPKSEKLQQNIKQNKTNKTTIFLPKINKVFPSPI